MSNTKDVNEQAGSREDMMKMQFGHLSGNSIKFSGYHKTLKDSNKVKQVQIWNLKR